MATDTNAAPEALVRFATRVSHDMNNFSAVVRTFSELLLSDLPDSNPMHADIAEIHRAADATIQYIRRVTQFSRARNMRRLPILVDDGIDDALAMLATALGDRAVRKTLGGGRIQADASWWRDVVIELLRNAHEAAPAGSAIVVRSATKNGTVTVDVEDEGEGSPADLLATVTEPFVTSRPGVRGAGIGLAIVAAFVHTLGGSIQFDRVDGTAGERTRVRLTLPA